MTVSNEMYLRLERIQAHLQSSGSKVETLYGFMPVVKYGTGHQDYPWDGPAGFSWIAFFFPFAVCYQIGEYTYFAVLCIILFIRSLYFILLGLVFTLEYLIPPCILLLGLCYGYMFPYLRFLARQEGRQSQENPIGISIGGGILLSVAAIIPAATIGSVFAK